MNRFAEVIAIINSNKASLIELIITEIAENVHL